MADRIGFDPTNRTIDRRPERWALIAIGIGWAAVIGFVAIVAKVVS